MVMWISSVLWGCGVGVLHQVEAFRQWVCGVDRSISMGVLRYIWLGDWLGDCSLGVFR